MTAFSSWCRPAQAARARISRAVCSARCSAGTLLQCSRAWGAEHNDSESAQQGQQGQSSGNDICLNVCCFT